MHVMLESCNRNTIHGLAVNRSTMVNHFSWSLLIQLLSLGMKSNVTKVLKLKQWRSTFLWYRSSSIFYKMKLLEQIVTVILDGSSRNHTRKTVLSVTILTQEFLKITNVHELARQQKSISVY